jgi:hypothetical protein
MKIQNVSTTEVEVADLQDPRDRTQYLRMVPNDIVILLDEDAAKSTALVALINAGKIVKIGDDEPGDGGPTQDRTRDLEAWVLSTDTQVQFATSSSGMITSSYSGTHGTPVPISLWVTNGIGIKDLINSLSTVQVSVTGGTASGKTINGGAGPVTVTFAKGAASASINATSAGTVTLGLSSPTHPSVTLTVTATATVTLA